MSSQDKASQDKASQSHGSGSLASSSQAATTIRTTLAIVTANLLRDHDRAAELSRELTAGQAGFALLVTSEYLSQAIRDLAVAQGVSADELWQRYCLRTERAIERASTPDGTSL